MLLISKLVKNTILCSVLATTLFADKTSNLIKDYIKEQLDSNRAIKETKVTVNEVKKLEKIPNWKAYIVNLEVTLKKGNKHISQKNIFFSNGEFITNDFRDLITGDSIKDSVKFKIEEKYYKDYNLLSGSKNSKHRVAVFSDPLCPFCRRYVPTLIKDLKKNPNKFALYYFHLPLERLHPAALILVKAFIAAELKGYKLDILKLYTDIQPDSPRKPHYVAYGETDVKKILKVFNEVMHTNLKPSDLKAPKVESRLKEEIKTATDLMVAGTPTVYFDDVYDKTRKKYKEVK